MQMQFPEHKYAPEYVKAMVEQRSDGLKKNRGLSNLLVFGTGLVAKRLAKDQRRYLDYGPYWWALKQVLRDVDKDYGDQDDPMVRAEYSGDSATEILIAADEFRNNYLAQYIIGNREYILNPDSTDKYILFDIDMENIKG